MGFGLPRSPFVSWFEPRADDIEASVCRKHPRCNNCGIMVNLEQSIFLFGTTFCMECGTAAIESESEDDGLRAGLAADLARQEIFTNHSFFYGLNDAHKPESHNHKFWARICLAAPEVGEEWLKLRGRCS